jgi:hypothetical protein
LAAPCPHVLAPPCLAVLSRKVCKSSSAPSIKTIPAPLLHRRRVPAHEMRAHAAQRPLFMRPIRRFDDLLPLIRNHSHNNTDSAWTGGPCGTRAPAPSAGTCLQLRGTGIATGRPHGRGYASSPVRRDAISLFCSARVLSLLYKVGQALVGVSQPRSPSSPTCGAICGQEPSLHREATRALATLERRCSIHITGTHAPVAMFKCRRLTHGEHSANTCRYPFRPLQLPLAARTRAKMVKINDRRYDMSQTINLLTGVGQTATAVQMLGAPAGYQVRRCGRCSRRAGSMHPRGCSERVVATTPPPACG